MKLLLISLGLSLLLSGQTACDWGTPVPEAEENTMSGWYVVGSGDTLTAISVQFYGDVQYWHHLRDLNVEMGNLQNSSLRSSDKIYIPNATQNQHLLITNETGMTSKSTRL